MQSILHKQLWNDLENEWSVIAGKLFAPGTVDKIEATEAFQVITPTHIYSVSHFGIEVVQRKS